MAAIILYITLPSVCLYALTLYQATDCSAVTDQVKVMSTYTVRVALPACSTT